MDFVELRKYNAAGTSSTLLPFYSTCSVSDVFCDAGYGSFTYPLDDFNLPNGGVYSGARTLGLTYNAEIGVVVDSVEVLRFIVEAISTTHAADGQSLRVCEGRSVLAYFEDAIVHPNNWPVTVPSGHAFSDATPGNIMRTLVARAVERNTLATPALDVLTFSGTATSSGATWTKTQTINYSNGYTYLQVLQDLYSSGMAEYKMVGRSLRLYNSGELSGSHLNVIVRRGQNATEASSSADAKDVGTVVMIEGDESVALEVSDATAIANYRRREKYVSQGGITDSGTLTLIAQATLDGSKVVPEQFTVGVTVNDTDPQPWADYTVGNWIKLDRTGVLEDLQVQQIALEVDQDRHFKVGITVGTLLDDAQVKLQRKINNIVGGNSGTYGPLPNPATQDKTAPAAPASVTLTPSGYINSTGAPYAQVTIGWPAVLQNTDGTACDDLDHYEVQTQVGSNPWMPSGDTTTTTAYVSNLPTGQTFKAQVRAIDTSGNTGPWATSSTITLPGYIAVPQTPSTPSLTNSIGSLYVSWNGNNSSGVAMGAGTYRHIEVHTSNGGASFTPTTATLKGTLSSPGLIKITGLTFGITYWARLVCVDWATPPNRSAASTAASLTPTAIVTGDVTSGAITTALIAANAVTTTQIADGSISTPKIITWAVTAGQILAGSITTEKIAAGAVTADQVAAGAITAGSLAADAITGKTITGGSITGTTIAGGSIAIGTGFTVDAAGLLTATGATVTGTIRTADAATTPRLEMLSGANNTIIFYSGDPNAASPAQIYNLYDVGTTRANLRLQSGNNVPNNRNSYIRMYSGQDSSSEGILIDAASVDLGVNEGTVLFPDGSSATRSAIPGSGNPHFHINPGQNRFTWTGSDMDTLTLRGSAVAGSTANAHFNSDAQSVGLTFGNQRLFVENTGGTKRPISASAFTQVSARETKKNIKDLPYKALDKVNSAKPQKWQYKDDDSGAWHVSPMAEDLPGEIVTSGATPADVQVDVYSMVGLLWQAVRELNVKVSDQENRLTTLISQLPKGLTK